MGGAMSPTPKYAKFFSAVADALPESNVTDDWGGCIFIAAGKVPAGLMMILSTDPEVLDGTGMVIGTYKISDYDFGTIRPVVTQGVIFGADMMEYPDTVPNIVAAVNDQIAAIAARK